MFSGSLLTILSCYKTYVVNDKFKNKLVRKQLHCTTEDAVFLYKDTYVYM